MVEILVDNVTAKPFNV